MGQGELLDVNSEANRSVDFLVGERVRKRRREMGISQSMLASALGVSFQQVQKYERGVNRLSASMLVRTCAYLTVSVSDLVGETPRTPKGAKKMQVALKAPGAAELLNGYARLSGSHRNVVRSFALSILAHSQGTIDESGLVADRKR